MNFARYAVKAALQAAEQEKKAKLELLQRVASLIEKHGHNHTTGICSALVEEGGFVGIGPNLDSQFNYFFNPGPDKAAYFMAFNTGKEGSKHLSGNQMKQRRLTAVALMMAMVEAGDL